MYGSGAYGSTQYGTSGTTAPDTSQFIALPLIALSLTLHVPVIDDGDVLAFALPLITLTMNLHAPEMMMTPRGEPIARDVRVLRIIDR